MTELAFVMSPEQSWFFKELVAAIRDELEHQGIPSSLHLDGFPPPRADRVYVLVAPDEFVALAGKYALPADELLARTILICTERPSTARFEGTLALGRRAGTVFDISREAVEAFERNGVSAHHFQLGYASRWDRFDPAGVRDVDVVFLASCTERRMRYLNEYARVLSRWRNHLVLSDSSRPNSEGSATFLADEKWDLLARSKVLINIHQGASDDFEWLRVLDGIHCGAVVVSEYSRNIAPLEPGKHLFMGRPGSLALIANALLRDENKLRSVRSGAYDFIRSSLPMARSVAAVAGAARVLVASPLPEGVSTGTWRRSPRSMLPDPFPPPQPADRTEEDVVRRELKAVRTTLLALSRELAQVQHRLEAGNGGGDLRWVRQEYETVAWGARRSPTVSVLTALYNHRDPILGSLDSLDRSLFRDFELIVVDDASTDGSGDAARAWLRAHPYLPARLIRHAVNRGVGSARNTAMMFARGRYCFVLDADNEIYPRCLDALVQALESDQGAMFAYPILETFGAVDEFVAGGGTPLVSQFGWEPLRLRSCNYIDALALIRTEKLRELGGYTTDLRCHGWEDYDLWCTVAERGWRGLQVPQILARYRTSPTSMLSFTNSSRTTAALTIIERHPRLMGSQGPGPSVAAQPA
jgi:GT2 family glycosyltransferase